MGLIFSQIGQSDTKYRFLIIYKKGTADEAVHCHGELENSEAKAFDKAQKFLSNSFLRDKDQALANYDIAVEKVQVAKNG